MDWIAHASQIIGVPLHRHTATKANGPCPKCHAGVDRLVVFEAGNWWCNTCHESGWWLPKEGAVERIQEAKAQALIRQTALLAQMATCQDWIIYQKTLRANPAYYEAWYEQGMSDDEIQTWGLGYCAKCPLEPEFASLTLPVFYRQTLVDIRHRLIGGQDGNKYRSHLPGLVPSIYNADNLGTAPQIIVVEGEKKTIASVRAGFSASLGLPGAMFGEQLLDVLQAATAQQTIILALDPDKIAQAESLALRIGSAARVADFPTKPDDFLFRYGAQAYAAVIQQARKVRVSSNGRN